MSTVTKSKNCLPVKQSTRQAGDSEGVVTLNPFERRDITPAEQKSIEPRIYGDTSASSDGTSSNSNNNNVNKDGAVDNCVVGSHNFNNNTYVTQHNVKGSNVYGHSVTVNNYTVDLEQLIELIKKSR
jgi:hypothetical protein